MGFGPPGAPSKNPATADKAEKKKRGARTVTHGKMHVGSLFVDLCAIGLHANCITGDDFRSKGGVLKKHGPLSGFAKQPQSGYISPMTMIPIREAQERLLELARRVDGGETITVTLDGKPMMDLVPAKKKGGIDWEGLRAFKKEHGITQIFGEISEDFDDPLPEDFLITPLPPFLEK